MGVPMQQERLFYEDVNEALRELVNHLGGAKRVGPMLWPEKSVEQAHTLLLACFNSERRERLTPEQVMLLLRLGREQGRHSAMNYICEDAGYSRPEPVNQQERLVALIERYNRTGDALLTLAKEIQQQGGTAALRVAK